MRKSVEKLILDYVVERQVVDKHLWEKDYYEAVLVLPENAVL